MSANSSSIEAMETMIKRLTQFQQVQQEMQQQLKNQYESIGSEWNDKQYQKLGGVIDDITTTLSTSYSQISECTIKVQTMKRMLEAYLDASI